jgi:hypothetical protein
MDDAAAGLSPAVVVTSEDVRPAALLPWSTASFDASASSSTPASPFTPDAVLERPPATRDASALNVLLPFPPALGVPPPSGQKKKKTVASTKKSTKAKTPQGDDRGVQDNSYVESSASVRLARMNKSRKSVTVALQPSSDDAPHAAATTIAATATEPDEPRKRRSTLMPGEAVMARAAAAVATGTATAADMREGPHDVYVVATPLEVPEALSHGSSASARSPRKNREAAAGGAITVGLVVATTTAAFGAGRSMSGSALVASGGNSSSRGGSTDSSAALLPAGALGHQRNDSQSAGATPATASPLSPTASPARTATGRRSGNASMDSGTISGSEDVAEHKRVFAPTKFNWSVQRVFLFVLFLVLGAYDIATDILVFTSTYAYASALDNQKQVYRTTILAANTSFTNASALFAPECTQSTMANGAAPFVCYLAETVCVQDTATAFVTNTSMPLAPLYTDPDYWVDMDVLTGGQCFYTDLWASGDQYAALVQSLRAAMWACLVFVIFSIVIFLVQVYNSWRHRHYGVTLLLFGFVQFFVQNVPQLAIQLFLLAQRLQIDCLLCIIGSSCGALAQCVAAPDINTSDFANVIDADTAFASLRNLLQNAVVLLYMSLAGIALSTLSLSLRSVDVRRLTIWSVLYLLLFPAVLAVLWLPLLWTLYAALLPALGLGVSTIRTVVFVAALVATVLAPFVLTLIYINVRLSILTRQERATSQAAYNYNRERQLRAEAAAAAAAAAASRDSDGQSFLSRGGTLLRRLAATGSVRLNRGGSDVGAGDARPSIMIPMSSMGPPESHAGSGPG